MSVKSSSLKENENVSKIEFFSTPKLSRNIFNGNEEDKNSLLDQSIDDLVHNLEQRLLLSSPTCDKENHHNLLECNRSDCCSICLSPLKSDSRGNRNLKLTKCQVNSLLLPLINVCTD